MRFDTIVRGGRVVTASDVLTADIGITDGRIAAIGTDLGAADEIVDAAGLIVMPGGVDSHVHISQPSGPGIEMADDFASASAAAACGGQYHRHSLLPARGGQSLRASRRRLQGQGRRRLPRRLRHPPDREGQRPTTLGQDLPALLEAGHTSFKVFMTYEGLRCRTARSSM